MCYLVRKEIRDLEREGVRDSYMGMRTRTGEEKVT